MNFKRTLSGSLYFLIYLTIALSGCGNQLSEQEYLSNAKDYWEKANYRSSMIEVKNVLQINPNNGEARLLLGRLYLKFNDGAAGEKEIRRASKLGVSKTQIMSPLVKSLLLQKKYQEAIKHIEPELISESQDKAELYVLEGLSHFGLQETEMARQSFDKALKTDGGVKGGYLGLARVAALKQQPDIVERYLDKAIKQQPENLTPVLLKGELYLSQNKVEQAELLFREIVKRTTRNDAIDIIIGSRVGLIRALLALKKTDDAARISEGLVEYYPNNPTANYYRALTAYQQHDYKNSETHVRNVLKEVPNHAQSIYLLGAVSYAQKNYEQAIEYLGKFVTTAPSDTRAQKLLASSQIILKQPRDAMAVLEQALESDPDDPQLLAMMGDVSVREGEYVVGSKYLEKAVSLEPGDSEIRADLAKAYLSMGRIEDGIRELNNTLAHDSQHKQAQLLLIMTYFNQKDYDSALNVAKKFLTQNDKSPLLHNLIGGIYAAKGDLIQSREHFEKAVKLRADYRPAMVNLARMDFQQGNMKSARKRYEALLSIDPDNISVIMGLAQVLENAGEKEEAVKWLKHAHETNPDSLAPILVLGQYLLRQQEYAQALKLIEVSSKRYPDNVQLLFQSARANLGMRNYKTAQDILRKVISIQPRSTISHYFLALAHAKNNERTLARISLNNALKINPTYLPAAKMLVTINLEDDREKDARKIINDMQKEFPGSSAGFELEGDFYTKVKDFPRASKAYKNALMRDKRTELIVKYAASLYKINKSKQAIQVLTNWLTDNPHDVSVHTILANEYYQGGNTSAAISYYEKILQIQPNHLIALNNLAVLYMDSDLDRAVTLANHAYQLRPGAVTADTLGWIKLSQGDKTGALRLLKQAVELAPGSHEINYHLAVAYARNQQKDEAREILDKILKDGVSFNGDTQARELLKSL